MYTHFVKLGQTATGSGASAILGIIGYKGTQAFQDEAVLSKLYDAATIIPAVLLVLMFILMKFCYKLTKVEVEKLHEKLYSDK